MILNIVYHSFMHILTLGLQILSFQNPTTDLAILEKLTGCYDLHYMFREETPLPGKGSEVVFQDASREWVELQKLSDETSSYQLEHFFQNPRDPSTRLSDGSFEIKQHHAEVWTALASGEWKQEVFFFENYGEGKNARGEEAKVDRSSCTSAWQQKPQHSGPDLVYRHCEAPGAKRPQRHKYTGRSYETLDRSHSVFVYPDGSWYQISRNTIRDEKLKAVDGSEIRLDTQERGAIAYRKIADVSTKEECFQRPR